MESYQIDIINPKAKKLLKDLAEMNLISIKKTKENNFLAVVERIRKKAAQNPPTFEEITKEVELVRAKRYERQRKK